MADMRLIVAGAGGRMGRALVKAIAGTPGLVLHSLPVLQYLRTPRTGLIRCW